MINKILFYHRKMAQFENERKKDEKKERKTQFQKIM